MSTSLLSARRFPWKPAFFVWWGQLWRLALTAIPLGWGLKWLLTSWAWTQISVAFVNLIFVLCVSVWALRESLKGPHILIANRDTHQPEPVVMRIAFQVWFEKNWRVLLLVLILLPVFRMLKPWPVAHHILSIIAFTSVDIWMLREALGSRYKFFEIKPSRSALQSALSPKG